MGLGNKGMVVTMNHYNAAERSRLISDLTKDYKSLNKQCVVYNENNGHIQKVLSLYEGKNNKYMVLHLVCEKVEGGESRIDLTTFKENHAEQKSYEFYGRKRKSSMLNVKAPYRIIMEAEQRFKTNDTSDKSIDFNQVINLESVQIKEEVTVD